MLFGVKACIEYMLIGTALFYVPTELHQETFVWYLLVAGLAQGSIFAVMMLLFLSVPARRIPLLIPLTLLGAGVTWLGANVAFNFSALALCSGSSIPLHLTPASLQTLLGACCGSCVAAGARRAQLFESPTTSTV